MARNNYKYAAKNRLRFPFKGQISVEDLFSLSLTDLDTVYKNLKKQVKTNADESLMTEENKEDKDLTIKIEIVTEIFNEKKAEADARKKAAETRAKNQKIAAIIARKEDEELNNKSVDELKAMLVGDEDDDAVADEE